MPKNLDGEVSRGGLIFKTTNKKGEPEEKRYLREDGYQDEVPHPKKTIIGLKDKIKHIENGGT